MINYLKLTAASAAITLAASSVFAQDYPTPDPFGNIFELYSHSYELTYSAGAYD